MRKLDMVTMTSRYRGSGDKSDRPALLLGSITERYANEAFSSRNLAPAPYGSVAARFIAADEIPVHDNGIDF